MVQRKTEGEARRRGRPRAYDPETALRQAMGAFWKGGYAGTSLDDISAATGMNRPSLSAAFGDKRTLYLKALHSYWDAKLVAMSEALRVGTLEEALMRAYDAALAVYFSGDDGPLGCFVLGTALTEALDDAEVRAIIDTGFRKLDAGFEARFRLACETGDLKYDADTGGMALLACATMQTLAIRARAGIPEDELRHVARKAASMICGSV
ncbi:TetR/AcrR family transcriptional regulator [Rhizorhabdus argentea]|uniref:TetR/AcrR family transcriptional regulator n=1 Tax=Rhizorhabdus argentea TaxID=1387174 RepID=UPI0030EB3397